MVEKIEKIRGGEYWQVAATKETKEEKKQGEKGSPGQEQKDSFGETSDFIQLLAKDPRKFSRETLTTNQIKGLTFRSISTNRDKSLLEVDINLTNGTLIKGAQIALSRQEGMRYLSRRPGEQIVVDQIVQGTFLTVAVPQRSAAGSEALPPPDAAEEVPQAPLNWFYYLGLGALAIALALLVYVFFS